MKTAFKVSYDELMLGQPSQGGVPEWQAWKANPSPATMAVALKKVQPTIDSAISRFPGVSPAVLGGEGKRLAIQAIKSFDPAQGATLSTHVFNHLRPLGRWAGSATKAINVPRDAREDFARYANAKRDFFEQNNQEASDADLQDILGINRKKLMKLHQMNFYEFPEGAQEDSIDVAADDDRQLDLWADYVYHDLNPRDRLIMDLKMGRNGQPLLDSKEIAAKLGIHPTYVNRRAEEIAQKIKVGLNG